MGQTSSGNLLTRPAKEPVAEVDVLPSNRYINRLQRVCRRQ
ncbi:hypothetical protein O9993_18770 [Vibrio lentus]|nr:hypothetical protein [Vibrio lentus]